MAIQIKLSDGTALVYDDPDGMRGIRDKINERRQDGQLVPVDDRESGDTYLVNPAQIVFLKFVD